MAIALLLTSCATNTKNESADRGKNVAAAKPFFTTIPKPKALIADSARRKPYLVTINEAEKAVPLHEKPLMTISFKTAPLETVVKMLSDERKNFNYYIKGSAKNRRVKGLTLRNVPWDEALQILAKLHNLQITNEQEVYIISTYDDYMEELEKKSKLAKLEKENAEIEHSYLASKLQAQQISDEGERTFKTIKLKYVQPKEVKKYLREIFQNKLTRTKNIRANLPDNSTLKYGQNISFGTFPKSSALTVHGTPKQIKQVEERLAEIDIPQQQVFIESRIVEILRSYSKSLGIQWGGRHTITSDPRGIFAGGTNTGVTTTGPGGDAINPGYTLGTQESAINFPAIDPTGGGTAPAAIAIQLSNAIGTSQLNARLSALEQEGKSKTISNPKITTINGIKAKIESGREIPYQTSAGGISGATTVEFKNAVLSLEVVPFVTPDENISLKILVKKDDADFANQVLNVPSILTRRIETNVMVENGGTAVLGGIFENVRADTEKGVPAISKIPVLGWLFKGKTKTDNEKELLIFISPKLIKNTAEWKN